MNKKHKQTWHEDMPDNTEGFLAALEYANTHHEPEVKSKSEIKRLSVQRTGKLPDEPEVEPVDENGYPILGTFGREDEVLEKAINEYTASDAYFRDAKQPYPSISGFDSGFRAALQHRPDNRGDYCEGLDEGIKIGRKEALQSPQGSEWKVPDKTTPDNAAVWYWSCDYDEWVLSEYQYAQSTKDEVIESVLAKENQGPPPLDYRPKTGEDDSSLTEYIDM